MTSGEPRTETDAATGTRVWIRQNEDNRRKVIFVRGVEEARLSEHLAAIDFEDVDIFFEICRLMSPPTI